MSREKSELDRFPNASDHVENGISALNSPIKRDPHIKDHLKTKVFKRLKIRDAWVPQLVEWLTLAGVVIPGSWD